MVNNVVSLVTHIAKNTIYQFADNNLNLMENSVRLKIMYVNPFKLQL